MKFVYEESSFTEDRSSKVHSDQKSVLMRHSKNLKRLSELENIGENLKQQLVEKE